MTPATIAAVVAEIKAYGRGERDTTLSWAALTTFSGFSSVSLWKKPSILEAFREVQQATRSDATPAIKPPKTVDERLVSYQCTVEELRSIIRGYDERWALYEYNIHRLGIDPEELRRPLDPVGREAVRSRGVRSVR
jgi:hypothetical protein